MRYIQIITFLVFVSCGQTSNNDTQKESSSDLEKKEGMSMKKTIEKTSKKEEASFENVVKINFIIDNILTLMEEDKICISENDTAKICLDIGETLSKNKVRIENYNYGKIEIYQRHINSLTITNEGPHCDMQNWKQYISEWEKLAPVKENVFEVKAITSEEMNQFVSLDIDEFKEAVKSHCGESWFELVKNIKSIHENPVEIGTNKIEFKIILTDIETKKATIKIIELEVPMGC